MRGWSVPLGATEDGINLVEVTLVEGEPAELIFLDLAIG
jgi:hypothetical protein